MGKDIGWPPSLVSEKLRQGSKQDRLDDASPLIRHGRDERIEIFTNVMFDEDRVFWNSLFQEDSEVSIELQRSDKMRIAGVPGHLSVLEAWHGEQTAIQVFTHVKGEGTRIRPTRTRCVCCFNSRDRKSPLFVGGLMTMILVI